MNFFDLYRAHFFINYVFIFLTNRIRFRNPRNDFFMISNIMFLIAFRIFDFVFARFYYMIIFLIIITLHRRDYLIESFDFFYLILFY